MEEFKHKVVEKIELKNLVALIDSNLEFSASRESGAEKPTLKMLSDRLVAGKFQKQANLANIFWCFTVLT